MKNIMKRFLFLLGFALTACSGEIRLPGILSDGMVLQRESQAGLWGKALPGWKVHITTSWDGRTYHILPGADSTWTARVRTGRAGGPYTVTIRQGRTKLVLNDILLGEVWLCSGQSNMQMPVMGYRSQPVEGALETLLDAPAHRQVRLLKRPRSLEGNPDATWEHPSLEAVSAFSAIGWHFAARISEALDMPVGIIESDWGGTRIEAWMPADTVRKIDPAAKEKSGVNRIGVLYDNMIRPYLNYTLRGFLWYQGESNKENSYIYADLMAGMVRTWRTAFGGGEQMPFYYVMVAPFEYSNGYDDSVFGDLAAPLLWEAQTKALDLIPNSGMAVTTDLGVATFIHPPHKREIGDRLALLALHGTYGEQGGYEDGVTLDWSGPRYKEVTFSGNEALVTFAVNGTLCPADPLGDGAIEGFEVAGEDRRFYPAEARMYKTRPYGFTAQVVVSSPKVPHPVAVRYGFHNVPACNLTSTLGLPVIPFRTDTW